jgi:DNA-directed RNA polymerase subunit RPC12/RpoP
LVLDEREIWFRCARCGRESYCGQEFAQMDDPDVLCPFCGTVQKLAAARLDLRKAAAPPTGGNS